MDEQKDQQDKVTLKAFMNGDVLMHKWVRKQYKLCILIAALVFVYILAGFFAQRQYHHLTEIKKVLQDKHFEQMTIEAELTERTRQSTITRQLREQGSTLIENRKPIIYIR
mgnify:FL=1